LKLVLVDSHDSFTHNLVQAFRALGAGVQVVQSDRVDPHSLLALAPDLLVLGPGPGRPEDSGCLVASVRACAGQVPMLGVCLGHQAMGLAFGGQVIRHRVVHGHATAVHHDGTGVFAGIAPAAPMTRYHSLVVDPSDLPSELRVTAWSDDGAILGMSHRQHPIHGIQFHPESVLSGRAGLDLLHNFVRMASSRSAPPDRVPATA